MDAPPRPAAPPVGRPLTLPGVAATESLAASLAPLARCSDVIALIGPLGAGKTTFARAFVRTLGGRDPVVSPTWSLVERHTTDAGPVWHFDLHRMEDADEVWELGLEDALADGISLIEWPEIVGHLLPPARLTLRLDHAPPGRTASLDPGPTWGSRLREAAIDV